MRHLFAPLRLGPLESRNRVVCGAHFTTYTEPNPVFGKPGFYGERYGRYLAGDRPGRRRGRDRGPGAGAPDDRLYRALEGRVPRLRRVGDALAVRLTDRAVFDGHLAGRAV